MTQAALAVVQLAPHTNATCGQSRGEGVETSNGVRRSKCFGRVPDTFDIHSTNCDSYEQQPHTCAACFASNCDRDNRTYARRSD